MKKYTKKDILEKRISFKPMTREQYEKLCDHFGFKPEYYRVGYYFRFYPQQTGGERNPHYRDIESYLSNDSAIKSTHEISFEEFDFEEELKELPENFCIKRDGYNPLWKKYINWLNEKYYKELSGAGNLYYGVWNKKADYHLKSHNATVLTLEQWDAIVNPKPEFKIGDWIIASSVTSPVAGKIVEIHPEGYYTSPKQSEGSSYFSIKRKDLRHATPEEIDAAFVLPKKWYVKVTEENQEILSQWSGIVQDHLEVGCICGMCEESYSDLTKKRYRPRHNPGYVTKEEAIGYSYDFGSEITWNQFLKYVLKENTMEKKIVGYKFRLDAYNKAASALYNELIFKSKVSPLPLTLEGFHFSVNCKMESFLKGQDLLEKWTNPVYKEQKKVFTLHCDSGTFELEVSKEGIYYAPDKKWLKPEAIREAIKPYQQSLPASSKAGDFRGAERYDMCITPSHIDMGCKKAVPVEDIKPIINYYISLQ